MDELKQIVSILQTVIRLGVVARVVFCLVKMIINNDDGGTSEYKQKISNAVVFLIFSELAWIIKDMVFDYYSTGSYI